MNEPNRLSEETLPTEQVSKSEVTLASEIMQAMVKASKGARMYQANNPLLGKFFQELTDKISSMLYMHSEYKLDVDRFELSYKGHKVYENLDPAESMAFRMYSDGIRSIIFSDGIEEWELREFLEIVNMTGSANHDDDIVTLLWDKGIPHCSYILEDDFQEIDRLIDDQMGSASSKGSIPLSCLADPSAAAAPVKPLPHYLYTLSDEDLFSLKTFIESEEQLLSVDTTAKILSAILSGVPEKELFLSFLEIYMKLARNLFLSGNSEFALKMFAFLYNRTTPREPVEERRRLTMNALGRFWTDEVLKGLCKIIDTTEDISADTLKSLSMMIGQSSPSALCELLGMVETMKMRKILIETTTEIARLSPELMRPYLSDSRWYLVRNMVFILAQLKNTALLDQIVLLITHRDLRVRKEVLKYLIAVPEPKAKPYILKFLRDESSVMRIMALQLMGRARLQFALKPIAAFVDTDEFEEMPISEKKAVYEAIGELGAEKMLPLFKSMLSKRFLFNRAKEMDAVICASAGLQKIACAESLKILEDALQAKSPEFRDVIRHAIQIITNTKSSSA